MKDYYSEFEDPDHILKEASKFKQRDKNSFPSRPYFNRM